MMVVTFCIDRCHSYAAGEGIALVYDKDNTSCYRFFSCRA